jgi:hypothetical protein
MKKKIYRTIVKFVVLSEEEIPENMDIDSILEECDSGEYIKGEQSIGKPRPLVGKTAVIQIEKAGSSSEFFNMDSQGNDLDEEDEEDETKDSAFDSFIENADMPQ